MSLTSLQNTVFFYYFLVEKIRVTIKYWNGVFWQDFVGDKERENNRVKKQTTEPDQTSMGRKLSESN